MRTWRMWATRRKDALWNVGSKFFVGLHGSSEPTVPCIVEEVDQATATHFGWERTETPGQVTMIYPRTGDGTEDRSPMMFLDMCFPYGLKAAIKAGEGKPVALRITESDPCPCRTAYECAHCNERRCMDCDERCATDEIKTAVRWCPQHYRQGRLGLLR